MRIVTFMVTIHFWRDVIQMYWWRSRHSNFLFCKIFREINFDVILTEFFGILPKSSLPNTWVATLAVAGGPGSRLELSILWSLNFSLSSCSRIEKLCNLSVNSWYSCQRYKNVKNNEFFRHFKPSNSYRHVNCRRLFVIGKCLNQRFNMGFG